MSASNKVLVEVENVTKRFGSVLALSDVNVRILEGEVVAFVGDNGAGKSTLMKILSGVHQPDSGEVRIDGEQVNFRSPEDSRRAGIEMVYQDRALAWLQTASENIFLGREPTRRFGPFRMIDHRTMRRRSAKLIEQLGAHVNLDQAVGTMSGGQQQTVAIARILSSDRPVRVVILDEPTAALAVKEVEKVLGLIRRLKERGITVSLISHRFSDIFEVADRIVVLRSGSVVGELPAKSATTEQVVSLMVGGRTSHD